MPMQSKPDAPASSVLGVCLAALHDAKLTEPELTTTFDIIGSKLRRCLSNYRGPETDILHSQLRLFQASLEARDAREEARQAIDQSVRDAHPVS